LAAATPWEALLLNRVRGLAMPRGFGSDVPFTTRPLAKGYLRLLRDAGHAP
jgi:hypothetical protein